ncbi:MAG: hypothetical protein LBM98_13525 [Oscillospiraceae bacterium]|jgi:hypothetical protein|nr:hypothetical protein [Oscillospiraceae bacterium]
MPSIAEISTRMTKAATTRNVLLHINEAEARTKSTPEEKAKILDELKIWLKERTDQEDSI